MPIRRCWQRSGEAVAEQAGLVQPISPELLEQYVFAKLYFDYQGLILACQDRQPVGFAHAGFGPTTDENGVSTELGTTCLILAAARLPARPKWPRAFWSAARPICAAAGQRFSMAAGFAR